MPCLCGHLEAGAGERCSRWQLCRLLLQRWPEQLVPGSRCLQLNQKLSFVYLLVIGDRYISDNAGNLGAEWGKVAANIGVIGDLVNLAALPGIPVSSNGNNDSDSEQHYQNGSQVF